MVLKTERYIYVMEFKFDGSAEEALKQIEEKEYAAPFANDPRQLLKAGGTLARRQGILIVGSWIDSKYHMII